MELYSLNQNQKSIHSKTPGSRADIWGDGLRSALGDHAEITATKFGEVIAHPLMSSLRAGIISHSTLYILCLVQSLVTSTQKRDVC